MLADDTFSHIPLLICTPCEITCIITEPGINFISVSFHSVMKGIEKACSKTLRLYKLFIVCHLHLYYLSIHDLDECCRIDDYDRGISTAECVREELCNLTQTVLKGLYIGTLSLRSISCKEL